MPNPVFHFEIGCKETEASAKFYESLFGWSTHQVGPAQMINTGAQEGIQGHFTALGHEPHHYTIFYVQVEDIPACLTQAEQLGGKVVIPKVDIPNYGSFAWFKDPDENLIGLWKPA